MSKVETDFKRHTVTVTFDEEKTDVKKIRDALEDEGFPSEKDYRWITP